MDNRYKLEIEAGYIFVIDTIVKNKVVAVIRDGIARTKRNINNALELIEPDINMAIIMAKKICKRYNSHWRDLHNEKKGI